MRYLTSSFLVATVLITIQLSHGYTQGSQSIVARAPCSKWIGRVPYAMWGVLCGNSSPHSVLRDEIPDQDELSSSLSEEEDDEMKPVLIQWKKLQELLSKFKRISRDGGNDFNSPLYII